MSANRMQVWIEDDEFHTILAALRYYQSEGMGDPDNRPDWLHDIASNLGDDDVITLDANGIDRLAEALNTGERDID